MIKVEVDFTGVEKAVSALRKEAFETALMSATQEIARELHKALLQHTPVVTGNLRKMWSAGENLTFTVTRTGDEFEVTLINDARSKSADGFAYAESVEYGHKMANGGWVAGRFFLKKSELQTDALTNNIVKRNLQKYFSRWLWRW